MSATLRLRKLGMIAAAAAVVFLFLGPSCAPGQKTVAKLTFAVSFPAEKSKTPLDGRILLLISNDGADEPRNQISDGAKTQLIFGIDVDGLRPGQEAVIDTAAFGYPLKSFAEIPAGEYFVQALFNRYETFTRADGHTVKLPPDMGEGQRWSAKPGNLYSAPQKSRLRPGERRDDRQDRTRPGNSADPAAQGYEIHQATSASRASSYQISGVGRWSSAPASFSPKDSTSIRTPAIRSSSTTAIFPIPSRASAKRRPTRTSSRTTASGSRSQATIKSSRNTPINFIRNGRAPDFPRVILMEIQHANPYYDDSYAVNSANLGPYGDAIVKELIPHIEKKYRGLGKGWARFLYGGSTGGWEALAAQVFYPDEFNGCCAACPDPIDFRAYTIVNIYEHKNAYYVDSPWK